MSNKFITSNITGIYVFDDGKLKESIQFPLKNIESINAELETGSWIKDEIEIIKKHPNAIFVGKKREKISETKLSDDPKKIKFLADYFSKQKSLNAFKYTNTIITKKAVKNSVTSDLLIIQSVKATDDMKKICSMLIKRLREWYEIYNPEFSARTYDHDEFVEQILKKKKEKLLDEIKVSIEHTMGSDLKDEDIDAILVLGRQLEDIKESLKTEEEYLKKLMQDNCPNVSTICDFFLGAKLIDLAGGLKDLINFPSGTIQLLGAEKALFRHIKTGNKPPKHGYIITHPMVASAKNRGRAARILANKILIAAKVDYYKGEFVGDKLKNQLEKMLKNA